MKYYRLLTPWGWSQTNYVVGKVYPENYQPYELYAQVCILATLYPDEWELVWDSNMDIPKIKFLEDEIL